MAGMAVTQQLPVPMRRVNKIQATGGEDAAEDVVPEELVTKDVEEQADASTTQHKHHQSETSREKWRILARF